VALQLKRQGITRVRPLHGGLELWMDRKFPTMELKLSSGKPGLESPARG
jgi:rhodanese-related sulfurtransferase